MVKLIQASRVGDIRGRDNASLTGACATPVLIPVC